MTIALPDIARFARNTAADAALAAEPGLRSGVQFQGLLGAAKGRLQAVERVEGALRSGIEAGSVSGSAPLADRLGRAGEQLRAAIAAMQEPGATGIGWGRRVPLALGPSADAHGASSLLATAADELELAARASVDDAITGVRRITPETSPVVARPGNPLRTPLVDPVIERKVSRVDPAWLEFDPTDQSRFMRVFDATAGRVIGTRFEGLEHVPAGMQAIFTSTHPSYLDPTALLQGIHRAGGMPVRTMAHPTVTGMLGSAGRRMGTFPTVTREFNGLDGARAMLRDGQAIAIFPEGDVLALRAGSAGEPRAGVALLASETGVPLVPSAGYGHQGRRAAGGARGARPVMVFGEPVRFQPPPVGATRAEQQAHVAEVGEVYAQLHDRLLQRAVASYR